MTWHLLQISDVLDIEFGTALAERVPLLSWEPIRTLVPGVNPGMLSAVREITDPPLEVQRFPLMRGYARFPWSVLARTGAAVSARLLRKTADPANSPLSAPFRTSPLWPNVGPVPSSTGLPTSSRATAVLIPPPSAAWTNVCAVPLRWSVPTPKDSRDT